MNSTPSRPTHAQPPVRAAGERITALLRLVERGFDTEGLLEGRITKEDTVDYYDKSGIGYRLFHSREGAVHMALNYDGKFSRAGYDEQARRVAHHVAVEGCSAALELASGRGYNTRLLAERFPDVAFTGVDLTPSHVAFARRATSRLPNVTFSVGDFEALPFDEASFDLVFAVESVCHAGDLDTVLAECRRVLRPGGILILFDGYRLVELGRLPEPWRRSARLVERSMSVAEGRLLADVLRAHERAGFSIRETNDLSAAMLPNLLRFQTLALKLLKRPWIHRLLSIVMPQKLLENAIAGLLMAENVAAGVQGYFETVARKEAP